MPSSDQSIEEPPDFPSVLRHTPPRCLLQSALQALLLRKPSRLAALEPGNDKR